MSKEQPLESCKLDDLPPDVSATIYSAAAFGWDVSDHLGIEAKQITQYLLLSDMLDLLETPFGWVMLAGHVADVYQVPQPLYMPKVH